MNPYFFNSPITINITFPPSPIPHNNNNNNNNKIHKIYECIITWLLALLQLRNSPSSANSKSPFQVHPLTARASVFSICLYYLAVEASLLFPRYATQLNMAMPVIRLVYVASLGALLVPEWPLMKYVFNFILAFLVLRRVLMAIYDRLVKRLMSIMMMRIRIIINMITNTQRYTLPLTQSSHGRI
ncbi:hypothetical protein PIB30_092475 [Stylosanthes scabra]|uniref:Uncharacterized protein n=1 Tax=Stylosanthes scabra TaxID=79078 RepID=A0ABU6WWR2_9FABA|nr:hypothetical protein [Stylosanthes scabra]